MKIEQEHIDFVRAGFASVKTLPDLVSLLNYGKTHVYGKDCKPFELKQITYYANPEISKSRYRSFSIKKKSGKERLINAPVPGLKAILRSLNFLIQCVHVPHKAATGFVLGTSIVDNAKIHAGSTYVYNIDLKDFFHAFDRNKVKLGFMRAPFSLSKEREPIAFVLACLCTHPFLVEGEMQIVLPQGSPTSPTITNVLCESLDRRLAGLAKRFGAKYSRYADDITFSANHNIYVKSEFIDELHRIIEEDQNLEVNKSKTRLQKVGYRQEVTGLVVNEKVNVRRRYVKQIRMWLYYWEKYGYQHAQELFEKDYKQDKGHVKKGGPSLMNVVDGKLEFLKMVKGFEDSTYKVLHGRFTSLQVVKAEKAKDRVDLNAVVNAIINKGLDEGIALYDKFKKQPE